MSWKVERPDKHGDMYVDTAGSLDDCLEEVMYLKMQGVTPIVLTWTSPSEEDHG